MADLQFVDFALMPGPAGKEKQFGLPGDFCKIDVTILSRMRHPVSGFSAVFHNEDGPADDPDRFSAIRKMFYTKRATQEIMRNCNISALRGRNRRLLATVV